MRKAFLQVFDHGVAQASGADDFQSASEAQQQPVELVIFYQEQMNKDASVVVGPDQPLRIVQRFCQHIGCVDAVHPQFDPAGLQACVYRYAHHILVEFFGIERGGGEGRLEIKIKGNDPVQCQVADRGVVPFPADEEPAVVEFLEDMGVEGKDILVGRGEGFVGDPQDDLLDDGLVERVQEIQAFQFFILVEVDDGLRMGLFCMDLVLEPLQDVGHVAEQREVLELLEHRNGFGQHVDVGFRQRDVGDGIVLVFVFVIFLVVDHDRGVVPEFLAPHQLDVKLGRPPADRFAASLVFGKRVGTGLHQVVQRPLAVLVLQALVDGLVADEGVLVLGHFGY